MEQISIFALPFFMFVSGYFVAFATGRSQRTLGWKSVFARVKSLLIPYLIWTLALIVWAYVQGRRPGPTDLAEIVLTGRISPAYYYVPLLIQLYLLAPFLIPVARRHPAPLLIVTALVQLAVQLLYQPYLMGARDTTAIALATAVPKWLFVTRLFWFSAGIVAGFHLTRWRSTLERWRWWFIGLALLLIPVAMLEWEVYARAAAPEWLAHRETLIDSIYAGALILGLLGLSNVKLPLARPVEDIGTRSYGIYLVHLPAMETFSRALYHLTPAVLGYQIILQPLLIAVGLTAPLLLMALVSRSPFSRYYRYLFG
jgi:peptidoglycan/LPS O-acetylase OafA/YrhL